MPYETLLQERKIHDPRAEFEKPSDIADDGKLSHKQKKQALENPGAGRAPVADREQ